VHPSVSVEESGAAGEVLMGRFPSWGGASAANAEDWVITREASKAPAQREKMRHVKKLAHSRTQKLENQCCIKGSHFLSTPLPHTISSIHHFLRAKQNAAFAS